MKRRLLAALLCAVLVAPSGSVTASAEILDYEGTLNSYKQDNKTPQIFEIDNGSGKSVSVMAKSDTVTVSAKSTYIRLKPGKNGEKLQKVYLGTSMDRVAVCDNGWSKVNYEKKTKDGMKKIIGYIPTAKIDNGDQVEEAKGTFTALKDSDILDYPGKKDGEVVGEVLELDEVKRTGTVNNVWSRIEYQNADGTEQEGYIPTSCLNVSDGQESTEASIDTKKDAGTLHKSSGKGVFSDALETDESVTEQNGVQIGKAVAASSDAKLKDLGVFKITHYCPCSICCGPYANGITSIGVTATTNHTIAVDPSQIPYGSKVVINGQVYVAEDCGGAIKTNCIDIYVATHAEGEAKGVYYTDVYLIQ